MKKKELPEKWFIRINKDNIKEVGGWFDKWRSEYHGDRLNPLYSNWDHPGLTCLTNAYRPGNCAFSYQNMIKKGIPEITLEEFRQITNPTTMDNETPKGFKLKDDKYGKAASVLAGLSTSFTVGGGLSFLYNSNTYHILKDAGVLDLWFEPIYGPSFVEGDLVYVISGGEDNFWANGQVGEIVNMVKYVIKNNRGAYLRLAKGCKIRKASQEEINDYYFPFPNIGGYDGKVEDNKLKFGCVGIKISTLQDLFSNIQIKNMTVEKGGKEYKITSQDIEKIKRNL